MEATRDTPLGIVPSVTIMKDYQKFGAMLMPSRVVQRVLGQEQIFTFTSYEFDSVPANAFDLPPAIKALIIRSDTRDWSLAAQPPCCVLALCAGAGFAASSAGLARDRARQFR